MKVIIFILALTLCFSMIGCSTTSTLSPKVETKEIIKTVEVPKEIIKEVYIPQEIIVEKEIVKEIEIEKEIINTIYEEIVITKELCGRCKEEVINCSCQPIIEYRPLVEVDINGLKCYQIGDNLYRIELDPSTEGMYPFRDIDILDTKETSSTDAYGITQMKRGQITFKSGIVIHRIQALALSRKSLCPYIYDKDYNMINAEDYQKIGHNFIYDNLNHEGLTLVFHSTTVGAIEYFSSEKIIIDFSIREEN